MGWRKGAGNKTENTGVSRVERALGWAKQGTSKCKGPEAKESMWGAGNVLEVLYLCFSLLWSQGRFWRPGLWLLMGGTHRMGAGGRRSCVPLVTTALLSWAV